MEKDNKLDKKLSPINVWSLAFGCIIGWGAFVMPGNTFLKNAGPVGTIYGMTLAAVIMIIIANNYNYMINQYPIAGGEFIYTKNTFGATHGFICVWFLGLSYATLVPMNATALALIGRNLLNNFFQVGFHYTVAGYDIYLGELLLALGGIILFALLSIRGVKFASCFQVALTVALVFGVVVIAAAALCSPNISMESIKPAFYPDRSSVSGVLAVLAVAPWAFVGFDTVPQAAEEFKFSPRKTNVIMIISIVFGGLVYIILNTVTAAVIPDGYSTWVEYINDLGNLEGLISLPTFNAAYSLLGNVGLIALGMAVLAAILSGIIGFYMATSRLLYSLSVEGVIPKIFEKLHPKYKTPIYAILFVMGVALFAPFFGRTALGWLVDMSSLGAAIGYGYTSAAAFKTALKAQKSGVVFTGIVGVVMSVIFAVLLLIPIPGLSCSLGKESYVCLLIWLFIGILFWKVSGGKTKRG